MRISRHAFGTLVGGAVLLAGCGKTPEEAAADRLNWLRGLDGVEKVALAGSADDQHILMTLVKRRSDQDITALIGTIRHEFGRRDDDYDSRIELDVDNYRAKFYLTLPARDLDVDRILWLRRDGRATGSTYGSSGLLVTAPPAAVAAVAVGLDQVVPSEDARRTHRVETADRQVVVQWTDCPSLDFRLDRAATQHFADLQQRYPGLTGWIEAPDRRASVWRHPDRHPRRRRTGIGHRTGSRRVRRRVCESAQGLGLLSGDPADQEAVAVRRATRQPGLQRFVLRHGSGVPDPHRRRRPRGRDHGAGRPGLRQPDHRS